MSNQKVSDDAAARFKPFLEELLAEFGNKIDSIYITGSALTKDFDPKLSDINSVLVLKEMDLKILSILAPMGKKYGKKGIAAPLIMTPEYINQSLDVFPIEFLNIQLLHHTVYGKDLFEQLEIKRDDLRHQCERELKVKLIGLRQGYISAAGDRNIIGEKFIRAIASYIPLFRGLIVLFGKTPPHGNEEVVSMLRQATGINTNIFSTILKAKREKSRFSMDQLNALFEEYYDATEKLKESTDAIEV